jgi:hypothetical protein
MAHCNGNACDSVGTQQRTDARQWMNVATVAFVAGGTAVVTGFVLYIAAPSDASRRLPTVGTANRVAVDPIVGPGTTGLAVRGEF